MIILKGYSDLGPALKSKEACTVKGIDWETRFVRPYTCHIVQLPAGTPRRVSTTTYSSIVLPHHKLLINTLPHPFSTVPLTSLVRVRLEQMQSQYPIAVAPMAEVSNNPYYPGSGVILDHVITFSYITNINFIDLSPIYDIVLDEGDNYILNNMVRVL